MLQVASLALVGTGVALLIVAVRASDSLGSGVSRVFMASRTANAMWMLLGGGAALLIEVVGMRRGRPPAAWSGLLGPCWSRPVRAQARAGVERGGLIRRPPATKKRRHHHRGCISMANDLVERVGLIGATLENSKMTQDGPLFENSAHACNHASCWNNMPPSSDGLHPGPLRRASERNCDGRAALKEHFKDADGLLSIGKRPLLAGDVGEHDCYRRPA